MKESSVQKNIPLFQRYRSGPASKYCCAVAASGFSRNCRTRRAVSPMENPIDFVSRLSLTFEQANLDHCREFGRRFAAVGDQATAGLLEGIYRDEIAHVAHGLKWFRRWKKPGLTDWEAFCQQLKFPLSPQRAKGLTLNVDGRREAGLDPANPLLARALGLEAVLEKPADNPFLAPFLVEKEKYAFQAQVFFLISRQQALASLAQGDLFSRGTVTDFLFERERIFAALHLAPEELALYDRIHAVVRDRTAGTPVIPSTAATTRRISSAGARSSTSPITGRKPLPGWKSDSGETAILWRSRDFGVISTSGLR